VHSQFRLCIARRLGSTCGEASGLKHTTSLLYANEQNGGIGGAFHSDDADLEVLLLRETNPWKKDTTLYTPPKPRQVEPARCLFLFVVPVRRQHTTFAISRISFVPKLGFEKNKRVRLRVGVAWVCVFLKKPNFYVSKLFKRLIFLKKSYFDRESCVVGSRSEVERVEVEVRSRAGTTCLVDPSTRADERSTQPHVSRVSANTSRASKKTCKPSCTLLKLLDY
jgi:hypothetical protein